MTNEYYATTAYDSTRPRTLEPLNRHDIKYVEKVLRKNSITSRGCHCNEYLSGSFPKSTVKELKNLDEATYQEVISHKNYQSFYWVTLKNKKEIVESIVYVAGYFWFMGIFGGIFLGLIDEFGIAWFYGMLLVVLAPFLIWYFGKFTLKRGWFKDENNVEFNRRTGLITIPKDSGPLSLPFDEFDPYLSNVMSVNAVSQQYLRLVHRYSDTFVICPASYYHQYKLEMGWERIQRFMDISQPLPDIPDFDIVREFDPVTAEYDKKNNRPKDYWKNLDIEDVEKMDAASIKAVKDYPWGKTRDEAIKSGWQPSGVGEGDWLNS